MNNDEIKDIKIELDGISEVIDEEKLVDGEETIEETEEAIEEEELEEAVEKVTSEEDDDAEEEKPKKKKNVKAILILSVLALIVLGAIGYFIITYIVPLGTYNKGVDYAKEGKLSEAIAIFDELDDYRDSEELYVKYVEEYARELIFDKKDYEAASSLLEPIYPKDEDIVMLLGYSKCAMLTQKAVEDDEKALEDIKALVEEDSISGVYSYAEVCLSNEEYEKAEILLNLLIEWNYLDSTELYNVLLESDPISRAKTLKGFADYADCFMEILKGEDVSVKFFDEDGDGLDEMLLLTKESTVKLVKYTGVGEVSEYNQEVDKTTFIPKSDAMEILEEKLIKGVAGSEEVLLEVGDTEKLQIQTMIDNSRNQKVVGNKYVNCHVDKVYKLKEGLCYVRYTYAMRKGKGSNTASLRSGDFTGSEYYQTGLNALNEMYGYAFFYVSIDGTNTYTLTYCSQEGEEYINMDALNGLVG